MTRSSDFSKEPEKRAPDVPVVLLAGPTAAGKTALSIELAKRLSSEIVNADSMQVYRYMDIGTAKPPREERERVPHHLIDAANPDEPFDAARYLDLARPVVDALRSRGIPPLVVGGTGLYMKVLTRGICSGPRSDPETKRALIEREKAQGLSAMHEELLRIDPEAASRIHPNDRQRILRALEVFHLTGVPLSASQQAHAFREEVYPAVKILLVREREELYSRIERRVDQMIASGLEEEVERLMAMGYGPDLKPMLSLGYKQMCAHILGKTTLAEAIFLIKRETRRYAKRQLTWFRSDPEFKPFHAEDIEGVRKYLDDRIG